MNSQEPVFELIDVVRVEPRGGYRLAFTFSDGSEGERDFADLIAEGGEMVEPLWNVAFFAGCFSMMESRLGQMASIWMPSRCIRT
jgi:hypothetical protein